MGVYRRSLLYTSDAADEEDSVDLGGRRFININLKQRHGSHSQHLIQMISFTLLQTCFTQYDYRCIL